MLSRYVAKLAYGIAKIDTDNLTDISCRSALMNMDNAKIIADWFDKAIEDSPLGNDEVAQLLGIDRTAVSKNRNSKRRVSAEEMILLAQTLGLPIPSLIENSTKPRINNVIGSATPRINGARFDNELYDLAFDKIEAADELGEPRMGPDEMLRQVHTLYLKLLTRERKLGNIALGQSKSTRED